jgi:nucleoside-diphosphate-sugar epimerase
MVRFLVPKRRKPDIEKARRVLKWEPKIELEEGLKRLVSHLQSSQ